MPCLTLENLYDLHTVIPHTGLNHGVISHAAVGPVQKLSFQIL